jgi:FkbM family methyltransferase
VTDSVGSSIFLYGVYEPLSSVVFASLLGDGDAAVDVGAHYGDYALLAAARVGPSGLVHAFAPQKSVRTVLEANVRTNGLTHVQVHADAVADYEGEADLDLLKQVETGQASLVLPGARPRGQSSRVRVRRMDDVIGGSDAARVTGVKVDIEGGEAAVLRGAEGLLQEARPASCSRSMASPCGLTATAARPRTYCASSVMAFTDWSATGRKGSSSSRWPCGR